MNHWHQHSFGHLSDGSRVMLVLVESDFRSRRIPAVLVCRPDGLHRLGRKGTGQLLAPGYTWPGSQEAIKPTSNKLPRPAAEKSLGALVPRAWGAQRSSACVINKTHSRLAACCQDSEPCTAVDRLVLGPSGGVCRTGQAGSHSFAAPVRSSRAPSVAPGGPHAGTEYRPGGALGSLWRAVAAPQAGVGAHLHLRDGLDSGTQDGGNPARPGTPVWAATGAGEGTNVWTVGVGTKDEPCTRMRIPVHWSTTARPV